MDATTSTLPKALIVDDEPAIRDFYSDRMPGVGGFEFWERSESARAGSGRRFIFTTGFLGILDTKEYDLVSSKTCITYRMPWPG